MYVRITIFCLPSEILPRSYLQTTLGNLFLSFSPGSKEKNTNLLDQGDRTNLLLQSTAVASAIAFHHVDVMKSLVKQINNKKMLNQPSCVKTKELYSQRIKSKRLHIFYFNSFVAAIAYFVCHLFEAFNFFCWLNRTRKIYFFVNCF